MGGEGDVSELGLTFYCRDEVSNSNLEANRGRQRCWFVICVSACILLENTKSPVRV